MAAILTRNSVLAAIVEVTEGTPVSPTAAGQYIPLQDDFTMEPAFEQLENAEMKASIGMSKSITGSENPTASFSHYLKHSGVEGTAPQLDEVLTAAFGTETILATEHDTIAASTTSVIKVNTGEGASHLRGSALLIKDSTNGYSIRPVHSVSTDDLTLGFKVDSAPAIGVNLGKHVTYSPANTGHQALTLWQYAGNGGATQTMSGARPTELGIQFQAGQLINMNLSFEGLEYYFNPIEITASTKYLDWTDDDGTLAATVATGFYKDPHELADAIATALNGASTETYTCTYSNTAGTFTIATSTSSVLTIKWNTGANTANSIASKIGFSTAADSSAALTYTGSAISFAAPQTPSYDSADPLVAKSNLCFIGDQTDNTCIKANNVQFTMSLPRAVIESICAESGRSGSVFQSREVTVQVDALIEQYDADKFKRYRSNSDTRFAYIFGEKSGGNWVAGKCGCLYIPTATISSFSLTDNEGLYNLSMEIKAYVDSSGNGEVYLSFV